MQYSSYAHIVDRSASVGGKYSLKLFSLLRDYAPYILVDDEALDRILHMEALAHLISCERSPRLTVAIFPLDLLESPPWLTHSSREGEVEVIMASGVDWLAGQRAIIQAKFTCVTHYNIKWPHRALLVYLDSPRLIREPLRLEPVRSHTRRSTVYLLSSNVHLGSNGAVRG